MGRTKKSPVIWQDHHNEGAFRSTWTSQANPDLFNTTGDETFPNANTDPAPDYVAMDNMKSDYKMSSNKMLKDGKCDNNVSSRTVMKDSNAICQATKDNMLLGNKVPPDANIKMGTSKTMMTVSNTTGRRTQTPPATQSTTEQPFTTNLVQNLDGNAPHRR